MDQHELEGQMIRQASALLAVAGLSLVGITCAKCHKHFFVMEEGESITICPVCIEEKDKADRAQIRYELHKELLGGGKVADIVLDSRDLGVDLIALSLVFPEGHPLHGESIFIRCSQRVRASMSEITQFGYHIGNP